MLYEDLIDLPFLLLINQVNLGKKSPDIKVNVREKNLISEFSFNSVTRVNKSNL